jgi:soluble lytic murein transglycosylase-like protein
MSYSTIILGAAKLIGVPGALLLAICTHESGLKNIISPQDHGSASYGVCQVKAATAASLGLSSDKKTLMNPTANAEIAARYLRVQLLRYDGDWCKSVAAYNSGTYNPSKVVPGKPRNLKYVKAVKLHLDEEHKDFLICGPRKTEEQ